MAIKKSQIYSTLWNSCDALRGAMDAGQYKDYVLIILFVKYLSDKDSDEDSLFEIPDGCKFKDFVNLKGKDGIGEAINKKLEAIKTANTELLGRIALPNFNDPQKLGKPKEMVNTLSKLIAAFENSALDFSSNYAAGDDILGDAYEYLMKNFAAESGKSKGQFYTPSEVSRLMAKLLHLDEFKSMGTTVYDPTCGSGSLLLRAVDEMPNGATLYGQEKDNSTATLAILNMLLHGQEIATIEQGDTLNHPEYIEGGRLKTFDICVANPPFSTKDWLGDAGIEDKYHRWNTELCPPPGYGDYAFLEHIIASMKPGTGRGACILPHGVLFRGGSEYDIRRYIVDKGYIEGIVGLPANVFFGTGIPASIILINKKGAADRKGIFFIDAKDGFLKDGNKNRMREQDIKYILDVWNERSDIPHFARFVDMKEIKEVNNYNLNIPRYVTPADKEIQQDINCHLNGGIPHRDVEQMDDYWKACPTLKATLFKDCGSTYALKPAKDEISSCIAADKSFSRQRENFYTSVAKWCEVMRPDFAFLGNGIKPKELIKEWSQKLLDIMSADESLVNPYDTYQQLMNYWADTLQDDCYMIAHDGWKIPLIIYDKDHYSYENMDCYLLPVDLMIKVRFADEKQVIDDKEAMYDSKVEKLKQMVDEVKEKYGENEENEEKKAVAALKRTKEYKDIDKERKELLKTLDSLKESLTKDLVNTYENISENEVKTIIIEDKWNASITERISAEMEQVTYSLTAEVTALAERYEHTLSELNADVAKYEDEVNGYLKEMGFNF